MFKRNQLNLLNSFSNYSNKTIEPKSKKSKKYFNSEFSISSPKNTEEKFYLSYDTYNKSFDIKETEKNCIMKEKCPYYKNSIELKIKTKGLLFSIKKMKSLNEILFNSLEKQTKLYKNLINENKILKEELFYISSQKQFLYKYKNKRTENLLFNSEEKNKKSFNINKLLNREIKSLSSYSLKNIFDLKENSEDFKNILNINEIIFPDNRIKKEENKKLICNDEPIIMKSFNKKSIRFNTLINNKSAKNHYNLINEYTNQRNLNFITDKMTRSLLNENIDYDTLIQNNKVLNELISITKTEKIFLSKTKNTNDDICHKLYDILCLLIDEHKGMIKLGFTLKNFIKYSINLSENISKNNSIKILLKEICKILSCKESSIFLLDKLSDSLIEYSNDDNIHKRIAKNQGIIGTCFTENKKIRIDNEKNGVLYYPITDKTGQTFGILKAENKEIPPFNNDDEELAKLISNQASNILNNFNLNDDNRFLIKKLNDIIDYDININNINSKYDFTEKTEHILLNLFDCTTSKYYFIENDKIIYYDYINRNKKEFDVNMGIVGKVIKIKSIYIFQNIQNCPEYNSLVDIKIFDNLLVIPILERKTKVVKGVAQIPYIGTINKNNMPKDVEIKLIKKFRKCIKYWLNSH